MGSYGGRASARPPDASHHTRMIRNQRSRARLSSSEVTTTGAAHAGTLLTGGHHRLVGTTQQWQRRACSAIHVSPHPPTRRKLEQSVLTCTQRATNVIRHSTIASRLRQRLRHRKARGLTPAAEVDTSETSGLSTRARGHRLPAPALAVPSFLFYDVCTSATYTHTASITV